MLGRGIRAGGEPDHDRDAFVVHTVVVDRGLQEVRILFEPAFAWCQESRG